MSGFDGEFQAMIDDKVGKPADMQKLDVAFQKKVLAEALGSLHHLVELRHIKTGINELSQAARDILQEIEEINHCIFSIVEKTPNNKKETAKLDGAVGALCGIQSALDMICKKLTEKNKEAEKKEVFLNMPIHGLDLTVKAANCLVADGILCVRDIVGKTEDELMKIPNFGKTSLQVVKDAIEKEGLSLKK